MDTVAEPQSPPEDKLADATEEKEEEDEGRKEKEVEGKEVVYFNE